MYTHELMMAKAFPVSKVKRSNKIVKTIKRADVEESNHILQDIFEQTKCEKQPLDIYHGTEFCLGSYNPINEINEEKEDMAAFEEKGPIKTLTIN